MKVNVKNLKDKNKTTIIMIRNGYGCGTSVPTKELKNKKVGDAILFMLDESLKDAIENGK
jgi:hypothetical protein